MGVIAIYVPIQLVTINLSMLQYTYTKMAATNVCNSPLNFDITSEHYSNSNANVHNASQIYCQKPHWAQWELWVTTDICRFASHCSLLLSWCVPTPQHGLRWCHTRPHTYVTLSGYKYICTSHKNCSNRCVHAQCSWNVCCRAAWVQLLYICSHSRRRRGPLARWSVIVCLPGPSFCHRSSSRRFERKQHLAHSTVPTLLAQAHVMAQDDRCSVNTTFAPDYRGKLLTPLRGHTYTYILTMRRGQMYIYIYVEDIHLWTAHETDHQDPTQLQTVP